jgi:hypothetical protein
LLTSVKNFLHHHHWGKRPAFLDTRDLLKEGNSLSDIHIALEVFGYGNSGEDVFPFALGLGFDGGELIFPPHSRQLSDYFSCVGALGGGGIGVGFFLF